jgi:hypothetical protein
MQVWTIPVAVVAGALICASGLRHDEPSERDMRAAFEDVLSLQVRNALEFAVESGGAEAMDKIRENRTDHFAVAGFRKLKCEVQTQGVHRCDFQVDLDLSNGRLERTLSGRFTGSAGVLSYVQEL